MSTPPRRPVFPRAGAAEETFLGGLLRQETVGGAVVLTAAVVAVVWANSPWASAYEELIHVKVGPLSLEHWAGDGALTLFFYLAGLELKRELLVGSLRRPADALVPVVAAVAGVVTPAALYLGVNLWADSGDTGGWAIPAATDIAFALAVLAVVGGNLPTQLRAFLLTLAVVDDLVVILIIAVFFTSTIHLVPLLVALVLLGLFVFLQKFRSAPWWIYVPLSLGIWWSTYESGVHATVAGVAMGLATRVLPREGETHSPAEKLEHMLTPFSAGVAVPFFALMSAGVAIEGVDELVRDPVAVGVLLGLVVGKPAGVLGGAWLVTRLTRAELGEGIGWRDLLGVALLAGVGFTVALLVSDLSFGAGEADVAKTAVLAGSVVSALLAGMVLRRRGKVHAARPA